STVACPVSGTSWWRCTTLKQGSRAGSLRSSTPRTTLVSLGAAISAPHRDGFWRKCRQRLERRLTSPATGHPLGVGKLDHWHFLAKRATTLDHTRAVDQIPLEDSHRRGIDESIRQLHVAPLPVGETRQEHIVHSRQPLGRRSNRCHLGEEVHVRVGGSHAVLQGQPQLERALAQAVRVLRDVPDVLAEQELDL